MKPCISQLTTLTNPFEADPAAYRGGGWTAVELWLTKLESFVRAHSLAEARAVLEGGGIRPVGAAGQGGLLLSRGAERAAHWDHFRRRLDLLGELGVTTMVLAADFAAAAPAAEDYAVAAASLGEAAELAAPFGIRIALEFHKSSPVCACLETALALVEQAGSRNAGVCLDVFHFQTGPSKHEDLGGLTVENLAWVQLCDVSGTPRELAADGDRILPGDGDFPLAPIVEHLERIGYDGFVALEVANPHLWQVSADRVADLGYRALRRSLGPRMAEPAVAAVEGGP
ncbi:MAG TPA: sugar phosphate isomerase/epimerase [Isosphaeraceae bacterium]|nr:sugar phosphate isomerase/epimerase [Isosphaeraceae bacterium]